MLNRTRRRLYVTWLNSPMLDVLGALAGLLPLIPGTPAVASDVQMFGTAACSVVAILAALVTFSLGFMYQSTSELVVQTRHRFGRTLRRTWTVSITLIILATVTVLAAVWLAPVNPRVLLCALWSALGVALLATARALTLFLFVARGDGIGQREPQS